MPKPPRNWPTGALPARMDKRCAAFFVGVSVGTFEKGVQEGRYPQAVREGSRVLWLTSELLRSIDSAARSEQPMTDADWLEELDRADADNRNKSRPVQGSRLPL